MRGAIKACWLFWLMVGTMSLHTTVTAQSPRVVGGAPTPDGGLQLAQETTSAWKVELKRNLARFGHRNWIVIADAAYPEQASPGIRTISTGQDHVAVVEALLAELRQVKHVRPVVYLDAELTAVPEADAPGIGVVRNKLHESLRSAEPVTLPHEEIIAKLDDAGKTFKILILKTNLTLPYTSVFVQLDCGYWSSDAEKRLRAALMPGK